MAKNESLTAEDPEEFGMVPVELSDLSGDL
jgi:hypothetical protein